MIRFLTLCLCLLTAGPSAAFEYWNDIRASALLPDQTIVLRAENPQGGGRVNTVLHADDGVQEMSLASIVDGPSTLAAPVPGPVAERRPYGFRLVLGDQIDLLPVGLPNGASPALADLTRLAADPVGDEAFGLNNLDLVDCRIGSDGTRLFAALTNAGGGFPVSSGLTFYSYLLGIKNPAVANPDTLFAMIYTVSALGIIEPGLYQINGTGVNDLVKIGEITTTELPAENTLLISCLWSDLTSNPVFQMWYDPADPRCDVAGFSQRITLLGGTQDADDTPGGIWHLREVAFDPVSNQSPQLYNLEVPGGGASGYVSVVYEDPDGNCPVISELVIDNDLVYPLTPQSLDYGAPVVYRSADDLPPLVSGTWSHLVVRFSDDLVNVVELEEVAVSVADTGTRIGLSASPNPFTAHTSISFELGRPQLAHLAIYDLRGRRVAELRDGILPAGRHTMAWTGRDDGGRLLPSGIYFYRLHTQDEQIVRQLTLTR